jgi:AbrB family looped-hinge helix DNA binding protein
VVVATLSSKGQLVIPKELRDHLGLRAGDVLQVEERDGIIIVRPDRPALSAPAARQAVQDVLNKLDGIVRPGSKPLKQRADDGALQAWVRTSDGVLRSRGEVKAVAELAVARRNKATR